MNRSISGSAAESLSGETLTDGWVVGERIDPPGGTGGSFSVRYHVKSANGERAFLKALDISATLSQSLDIVSALQKLLTDYDFERKLVEKCSSMSRVVRGLAYGQTKVPGFAVGQVPYLIFELADLGDVRRYLGSIHNAHDIAWKLSTLHHIATGVQQLHKRGIAHQDLKPSNVLVFARDLRKIADLGCASERGHAGPRDHLPFAGDPYYPPLETFYGYVSGDWDEQRIGCDIYLLGSMATFFFTQQSMSALILAHLDERFYPPQWKGTFEQVLPYLQTAFADALHEIGSAVNEKRIAESIVAIVSELCNPDPTRRGNSRASDHRSRFRLDAYISQFDLLAKKAMIRARNQQFGELTTK